MLISHSPQTPKLLRIRNNETGEEVEIDLKLARIKKLTRGFMNSIKLTPSVVKHLMLSQTVESYKPRILNYFLCALKRYYGVNAFLWTNEIQEKRLEKYGDAVLHWHILVAFEYGTEFTGDDILRMQRYWKYGRLDVTHVRRVGTGYTL